MELLYLDQNYLSGIVKRKVALRELEPALRGRRGPAGRAVPGSEAHRLESAARLDFAAADTVASSPPASLPNEHGAVERHCKWGLETVLVRDFPTRQSRASDRVDIRALAAALPR